MAVGQTRKVVIVKGGAKTTAGTVQALPLSKIFSPTLKIRPHFFNIADKMKILKEAKITEVRALTSEGQKVTLKSPNINDRIFITLSRPNFVSTEFYGTGLALFENSEQFYKADGTDKAFSLDFFVDAGKWYLIDCQVSEFDATYRVFVYQSSGSSQITFENPPDGHLLIVYQAAVSGQAYIAVTGNCPRQGTWGIYGAEITVIR
jgi:hypothetical protein